MKNIESKMKYSEHPLEKLFYNLPVKKDFDHSKILPQKNDLHTTTTLHTNGKIAVMYTDITNDH